jgi:hypothetical protein
MGCAKGQEYLYGRPLGAAQVRQLLAEKRLLAQASSSGIAAITSQRLVG